jgi:hypothetical protein
MARAHKNQLRRSHPPRQRIIIDHHRRAARGEEINYVAPVSGEMERHSLNQLERTPKEAAALL